MALPTLTTSVGRIDRRINTDSGNQKACYGLLWQQATGNWDRPRRGSCSWRGNPGRHPFGIQRRNSGGIGHGYHSNDLGD